MTGGKNMLQIPNKENHSTQNWKKWLQGLWEILHLWNISTQNIKLHDYGSLTFHFLWDKSKSEKQFLFFRHFSSELI